MGTTNEIRLFISSTFVNMQNDRAYLHKSIFPRFEREAEKRGVLFTPVDLRWGITEESILLGSALNICLSEIDRCKPYFIGLLGQYYGSLLNIDPTVEGEIVSLTEMEIQHRAFGDEIEPNNINFYFKSDEFDKETKKILDKHYQINPILKSYEAKQLELKNRIRESGLSYKEVYASYEELGNWIFEDLMNLLNRDFPEAAVLDEHQRQQISQNAFALSKSKYYIKIESYFESLNNYLLKGTKPLLISGPSGSGKSALVANWINDINELNIDIISHYCGLSDSEMSFYNMLHSIYDNIRYLYEITEDIPKDENTLILNLNTWLYKVPINKTLIIVIDGVNQLSDVNQKLFWIPTTLPINVKFIVSSIDDIESEKIESLRIGFLDQKHRNALIKKVLEKHGKDDSYTSVVKIFDKYPHVNLPIFVKTILEEMKVFGDYTQVLNQFDYYVQSKDVSILFDKVLKRLESDYSISKTFFALLYVSRDGLKEVELRELLSERFSAIEYYTFMDAVREHIVKKDGRIYFFHGYLKSAVGNRLEDDYIFEHRKKIISYYSKIDLSERVVFELPYQLSEINDKDTLLKLLTKPEFLKALGSWDFYALMYYSSSVLNAQSLDVALRQFDWDDADALILLGKLFRQLGMYNSAIHYLNLSNELSPNRSDVIYEIAYCYNRLGDYSKSLAMFAEYLNLLKQNSPDDIIAILEAYRTLGINYGGLGDTENSLKYYENALSLAREHLPHYHPQHARILNNIGNSLIRRKKLSEALSIHLRAYDIRKQSLPAVHPDMAVTLNNLGLIYYLLEDYESATNYQNQSLNVRLQIMPQKSLSVAVVLDSLGLIYYKLNNYGKAKTFFDETLSIRKMLLEPTHNDIFSTESMLNLIEINEQEKASLDQKIEQKILVNMQRIIMR